jgi:hypothetical protein
MLSACILAVACAALGCSLLAPSDRALMGDGEDGAADADDASDGASGDDAEDAAVKPACLASYSACTTDSDCCTLSCTDGSCAACVDVGSACRNGANCCTGKCRGSGFCH